MKMSEIDGRAPLGAGFCNASASCLPEINAEDATSVHISESTKPSIAIVGISTALPSGEYSESNLDTDAFWDFLMNKGQAYEKIPQDRFNIDAWKGNTLGAIRTTRGAFLKNATSFDHVELGVSAKDIKVMSPSTRKLIELGFLAVLDSGIDVRGRPVGCYMSGTNEGIIDQDEYDPNGSFANIPTMIANRVSYALDINGPSVSLDTACSSSLTAMHLAVQALNNGECEAALVGGCQYNYNIREWLQYSQGGVLAPDGTCKPFDASGNGFARGEGAVVVVVKRLADAVKDNDHIYATILGSAINSAGSGSPVGVPVGSAQKDCIRKAYAQTDRQPQEADFVELHATGTSAGDPVETNAVGETFARDGELTIGSLKGNMGHLEITAFLASLVKVCLILKNGVIPPNVNFQSPNLSIKWDEYKLRVPTEPTPLSCRSPSGKALISMSSFGIGGSNGHVIVEGPPVSQARVTTGRDAKDPVLLVVGGLSPRTAAAVADQLKDMVSDSTASLPLPLISTIYGRRARQMTWRTFAVLTPGQPLRFAEPSLVPRAKPNVVFVFSGQGPQNLEMGREFFRTHAVFRESVLEMDAIYSRVVGKSLIHSTGLFMDNITPADPVGKIWPIAVTLPAITMVQIAIHDLLVSLGVAPDAVLGHSAGETSLIYTSGAGPKGLALEVAIARGKAISIVEQSVKGTMAALSCTEGQAQALIDEVTRGRDSPGIDIACLNAHDAVAISGLTSVIDEIVALAESRDILARKIRTNAPIHSCLMEVCRSQYQSLVGAAFDRYPGVHRPSVATFSTLSGVRFDEPFTADYFWHNARGTVLFTRAVASAVAAFPSSVFVEISPHPVLSAYLTTLVGETTPVACPMKRPSRDGQPLETQALLETLGRVTTAGLNCIDFNALNGHPRNDPTLRLPSYPFNPKQVPTHADATPYFARMQSRIGPLNHPRLRLNTETHPILGQHIIKGEPIMPGAGFIEMALEFGARELWDVEFSSALSLSGEKPSTVEVKLDGAHWSVKSSSSLTTRSQDKSWTLFGDPTFDHVHSQGYLSRDALEPEEPLDLDVIRGRCDALDLAGFYDSLKTFADFGPDLRRVTRCFRNENEALVEVKGAQDLDLGGYVFHPAILDACFHIMVHEELTANRDPNAFYLPAKVEQIIIHDPLVNGEPFPPTVFAHVEFQAWTPGSLLFNLAIVDHSGAKLCTMQGFQLERHESALKADIEKRFDLVFQPVAIPIQDIKEAHKIVPTSCPDTLELFQVLDRLSAEALKTSLETDIILGEGIDRRRYLDFARAAVAKLGMTPMPDALAMEALRAKWPAHFEVTERVSRVNKEVFTSSKVAVEALFSDTIMTQIYNRKSDIASICEAGAATFREALTRIAAAGKRAIRVLEIGTGTGMLTEYLAEVLEDFDSATVEYVASDISFAVMADVASRTAYPHMRMQAFDLAKPIQDQGLDPSSFDIVTGLHVLHAVPELTFALASLQDLLVPGGSLVILELDGDAWDGEYPGTIWHDFIFGCFSEWFGCTDGRVHCALSILDWKERLHEAGFRNVITYGDSSETHLAFAFEAQSPATSQLALPVPRLRQDPVMLWYSQGDEMSLQARILDLNQDEGLCLWFIVSQETDGDAALGFSRSLRREIPMWDIHLAIFEGTWTIEGQVDTIRRASNNAGVELEVKFNQDGDILVSRIVPSASPSLLRSFNPNEPWAQVGSDIAHRSLPPLLDNHVSVQVTAWSSPGTVRGFVGSVLESCSTAIREGDIVIGVTPSAQFMNQIQAHAGLLVKAAPGHPFSGEMASGAVGLAVAAFAIGPATLTRSDRLASIRRVLVTHSNSEVARTLAWFFSQLGAQVTTLEGDATSSTLPSSKSYKTRVRYDLVLPAFHAKADVEAMERLLSRHGSFVSWEDPSGDFSRSLKESPWAVGSALEAALEKTHSRPCPSLSFIDPMAPLLVQPGDLVSSNAPLFDHRKSYLLVGGIGGLGMQIALWMYQNGARYIVLTSRSGTKSLKNTQDILGDRIYSYLRRCDDLTLRLEAVDAASKAATYALIQTITKPLGGCMLMSLVLRDGSFLQRTAEDFSSVFAAKTGAFHAFADIVSIPSLDFLITFSSVAGLLGNHGQTTYSSASTALDGLLRDYPNAFSLIVPGIIDAGRLVREMREGRAGHLAEWGMTSRELCDCIGDGICKLRTAPFAQYIPNLRWNIVEKYMGSSPIFKHLCVAERSEAAQADIGNEKSALDIVLSLLNVAIEDFSPDVPFTAYGLDSLAAVRLSTALRPIVKVSQLQLVGNMTMTELERRIEEARNQVAEEEEVVVWPELGRAGETIVKLRDGEGIPFIIIHGAGGTLHGFEPLQEKFRTPLWAIQQTPDAPTDSLQSLSAHYYECIKDALPEGPYRLGAFSASSTVAFGIARLMEAQGDELVQLAFIDHFPTLFASPAYDLGTFVLPDGSLHPQLLRHSHEVIQDVLRRDGGGKLVTRHRLADELAKATKGLPVSEFAQSYHDAVAPFIGMLAKFIAQLSKGDGECLSIEPFLRWLKGTSAPITVYIATDGINGILPPQSGREWSDLGVTKCFPGAKVVDIQGGHFDMLGSDDLIERLQNEWSRPY
ncbi:hypothetical protein BOTBODRAFT_154644 [Botryobasidium botryosum FD-172 SS1]|uniref:Carrier domain-containing protein n=1 Tax=Botryobasidium botryosum (strain FD-172 SS1) TaxID=930990 RepID=A0A067MSG7_BOTB1|nr:hypothetical protein BOTBODRAFT_154644 [Botryobasidium botryosum FD-172 SS1]